jgi:hypothetical protein
MRMKESARKRIDPPTRPVVRSNICLTPTLLGAAREMIQRGGYTGLSDYLQACIRRDAGLDRQSR